MIAYITWPSSGVRRLNFRLLLLTHCRTAYTLKVKIPWKCTFPLSPSYHETFIRWCIFLIRTSASSDPDLIAKVDRDVSRNRIALNVQTLCGWAFHTLYIPLLTRRLVYQHLVPLLEVKIEKEGRAVSANKPQQVTCRAVGSSPPPHISWWKAGARLQASHETVQ